MLELRVLTGIHAGARAVLPEGAQVLGSASDCDLILSDEGVLARHLRISTEADGSILLQWEDGTVAPIRMGPGEGAVVGPVQIAIEEAGAPWRTQVPVHGADQIFETGEPSAHLPPLETVGETAREPAATRRSLKVKLTVIGPVIIVITLAMVSLVWRHQPSPVPEASSGTLMEPQPASQRDALERSIRQVGMADRVQVEIRQGAPALVKAANLSDEEGEVLAIALSKLVPRPAMEITSEQEFSALVLDFVARLARDQALGLSASSLGDGRYAVKGRVADDGVRRAVQSEIRQAFTQARGFEWQLQTSEEATASLVDDLRGAGFDGVTGRWDGAAAHLAVSLDEAQVRPWEAALARVARRGDLPMRATVTFRAAPRTRTGPPQPRIRTVIGGALPYVVLEDGRKLAQGGEAEGWRLVEIQAGAVVFEGAGGRRLTMER